MTSEIPLTEVFVRGLYDSAFNREPDAGGLRFWVAEVESGRLQLSDLSRIFVATPEFTTLFQGKSEVEIVTGLYTASFGRTPSAGEVAWWVSYLSSGKTVGDLLGGFAFSPEQVQSVLRGEDPKLVDPTPGPSGPDPIRWPTVNWHSSYTIDEDAWLGDRMVGSIVDWSRDEWDLDWEMVTLSPASTITLSSHWGRVRINPEADQNGTFEATFKAIHPLGEVRYGSVTINITPVNDTPSVVSHQTPSQWLDKPVQEMSFGGATQTFVALGDTISSFRAPVTGTFRIDIAELVNGAVGPVIYQSGIYSPVVPGETEVLSVDLSAALLQRGEAYAFIFVPEGNLDGGIARERDDFYADGGVIGTAPMDVTFAMEFADKISLIAGSPAMAVLGGVALVDVDDTHLERVVVAVQDFRSTDILSFVADASLTVVFDPLAGTLTAEGHADVEIYQSFLRSITYAASDPGTRIIGLAISDGQDTTGLTLAYIDVA